MNEEPNRQTLVEIANLVSGLTQIEWDQIKHSIDGQFGQKAAKLQLGDPKEILRQMRGTVISRRLVSEQDLHDSLHPHS
jgi:hypothetical protein